MKKIIPVFLTLVLFSFSSICVMGQHVSIVPENPENLEVRPPKKKETVRVPNVSIDSSVLVIDNGAGQAILVEILNQDVDVVMECVTLDGEVDLSILESGAEYTLHFYMNGMWWIGTFIME